LAKGKKTGGRDFAKGGHQPANRGRPPSLPIDLKMANDLTKTKLRGILNKYLWMAHDEINLIIETKSAPMIELVVAQIIVKAAVQGDSFRLNFILERMVGKVKEEIDLNTYHSKLQNMSDSEVIDLGAQALTYLKGGND